MHESRFIYKENLFRVFRFEHIDASLNLVLRSALARVSKDGHKRDRASGHPSRRAHAGMRPPQDEVCGFKLQLLDAIGFMESIYVWTAEGPTQVEIVDYH